MKPILFNTEMVKAILDGRKTCARRVARPQPSARILRGENALELLAAVCAPYQPGDVLYVRETWSEYNGEYIYKTHCLATKMLTEIKNAKILWHPSIRMPRKAARLFLRVTDVRIERLSDMSEEDAIAEGFADSPAGTDTPLERFSVLWDKYIKREDLREYGWGKSPWVWVIEFERADVSSEEES